MSKGAIKRLLGWMSECGHQREAEEVPFTPYTMKEWMLEVAPTPLFINWSYEAPDIFGLVGGGGRNLEPFRSLLVQKKGFFLCWFVLKAGIRPHLSGSEFPGFPLKRRT